MAAGSTYTPIATTTLGSAQASYTFTSIPTTYTDLVLIVNMTGTVTGDNSALQVGNGSVDTASNYSITQLYGTGSVAGSTRLTNSNNGRGGVIGSTNCMNIIHFINYSNTTTYKTIIARGATPATLVDAVVSLWRSTSAINTIKYYAESASNLPSGTTLSLYGIAAA